MSFVRKLQMWFMSAGLPVTSLDHKGVHSPLLVDEPLCLVGDLHGCQGHLERLLQRREKEFPDHRLVVLGDMIDRGDESAAVLRCLHSQEDAVCLAGNHEAMLLGALDDPEGQAETWLACGGLSTLASFGMRGIPGLSQGIREVMAELRLHIGTEIETWLRGLPLWWQSGNLVMSHAGMDPARPVRDQSDRDLLWGHPDALTLPRRDGFHVAHGHYVVPQVFQGGGRIALDTGAYATGVLSYALTDPPREAYGREGYDRVRIGTVS